MLAGEPDDLPTTHASPIRPIPVEYSSVPPTGFRLWRVVAAHRADLGEGLPYLSSPYRETLWDRPQAEAVCQANSARFHPSTEPVPAITCKCGLYATKRPARLDIGGLVAIGEVELWGRVIEGTDGYRATKARVIGDLTLLLGCVGTDARPSGAGVFPRSYCRQAVAGLVLIGRQYRPLCAEHSAATLATNSEARAVSLAVVCGWLEARYETEVRIKGRHE